MRKAYHDIFRAIHEGKWLKIEYCNQREEITKFWIGIRDLDVRGRRLTVDGLHLGKHTLEEGYQLFIDKIRSSEIVEGTYCPVNEQLIQDIHMNPDKYRPLFDHMANLKILNYLEMCNRMDATPYYSEFALVKMLDRDSFKGEMYQLTDEQFQAIVKNFQYKMEAEVRNDGKLRIQQLAMNVLSIHTQKGLYVLAYRKLQLDVKRRVLRPDDEINICTEFMMGENKERIRKYLDADEYELLTEFEKNQETIKDCITAHANQVMGVDDMPYIIGLGMDIVLDLHTEYQAKMTNFATIINDLFATEDKNEYIECLMRCSLLIIDDLGAERSTEYAVENVFNVIDRRYRTGRPLIITTNLHIDTMRNETSIDKKRIYDRVFEMCAPVQMKGVSKRKASADNKIKLLRELNNRED